jgi:cytochrome c
MKLYLLAAALFAASPAGAQSPADIAAGEKIFKLKCSTCHTLAQSKIGPPLRGVVGRNAAGVPQFTRYSKTLKTAGWKWDEARLDSFLMAPQKAAPGNIMAFSGLPKPDERRQVIAYLRNAK